MPRLVLHSLAYLLMLVAVMSVIPDDSSFSGDAGAYGGQVHALRQGRWALDRAVPVVAEEHEGWLNTAITPAGPTPYTAAPGYAVALTGVTRLIHGPPEPAERAGDVAFGLHVLPVLSAVAAAAVAWLLADRFHHASAPLAFWLLALGPTLVNATTLWAHTLSTALGGMAVLAMLAATDRAATDRAATDRGGSGDDTAQGHRWVAVAMMGLALSAGAVVRTEGLFWLAAVVVVGLARARSLTLRVGLLAVGGVAASSWSASRLWGSRLRADRLPIETSIEALNEAPGWLAGRLPAAWMLLVNSPTGGVGPLITAIGVSAVIAAVYRTHRPGNGIIGPGQLLWLAVAAYVARLVLDRGTTISGVIGAWPAMAVAVAAGAGGFIGLRAGSDSSTDDEPVAGADNAEPSARAELWPLATPCLLLLLCVLATQYASSGGLQWGGRYLSFAFAPLAAAAAVAGRAVFARHRLQMLALVLVPAVIGLGATLSLHRHHRDAVAQAAVGGPEVVITESAALPRIAWRELPVAYYRASEDDVVPLLEQLAEAEVDVVNVHGLSAVDLDDVAGYQSTDLVGPVRRLELLATE